MELTKRQRIIINILKDHSPLTAQDIATEIGISVATIRPDLRFLTITKVLDSRPKVGYAFKDLGTETVDYSALYKTQIADILLPTTEIRANDNLQKAISQLFLKDVGSLYVVDDDDRLVGLISRKDLLRASLNNNNLESSLASVVMTRMPNIIRATPDMTVMEAGQLLLKHSVDSLPVVDKESGRKVIGKITKNRIFQHFIELGK
ncbi:helix-turn-helix transcriptional regulator [Oenococcus alcoholitolerans]|uniref:CBS domain-containing protein n=1 Tax=Oenococcus alcoholitolerans TaxID=931074 RepID=A0ABR4XQB5_9LACO|nr:hypothetical protein Q757_06700 [Oenococcus alcoholitolerans]